MCNRNVVVHMRLGISDMSQDIVQRILTIEQTATRLHDDAQQQAADIVAEAETASAKLQVQQLAEAHQKAEQIKAEGSERAEVERARILAQAGADAQLLDTLAAKNLHRAVAFVLDEVAR